MNQPTSSEASQSELIVAVDDDPHPSSQLLDPPSLPELYSDLARQAESSCHDVGTFGRPVDVQTECRMMPADVLTILEEQTTLLRELAGSYVSYVDDTDTPRTFLSLVAEQSHVSLAISNVDDRTIRITYIGRRLRIEVGQMDTLHDEFHERSSDDIQLGDDQQRQIESELLAIGEQLLRISPQVVVSPINTGSVETLVQMPKRLPMRALAGSVVRRLVLR